MAIAELTTNQKGLIGEAAVMLDLSIRGYITFKPTCDYSPVDLVVSNKNLSLRKIQIKYRKAIKGLISVPLNSVVNGVKVNINLELIDGWAIYCPDTSKVYYISKNTAPKYRTLRVFDFKYGKTRVDASRFEDPEILFYGGINGE